MKLLSFTLTLLCLTHLSAQEKRTELGVTYNTDTGFNILVKEQLQYMMFIRGALEIPNANFAFSRNNEHVFSAFDVGASIGLEFHIPLSKRFMIYHGPELSGGFSNYSAQDINSNTLEVGIGYFTGAIFKMTDRLRLFAELKHGFNYQNQSNEWVGQRPKYNRSNYYFDSSLTAGATFSI